MPGVGSKSRRKAACARGPNGFLHNSQDSVELAEPSLVNVTTRSGTAANPGSLAVVSHAKLSTIKAPEVEDDSRFIPFARLLSAIAALIGGLCPRCVRPRPELLFSPGAW